MIPVVLLIFLRLVVSLTVADRHRYRSQAGLLVLEYRLIVPIGLTARILHNIVCTIESLKVLTLIDLRSI